MSLCLTAGAFALTLAGQALHIEWTGAGGIPMAESWIVQDGRMQQTAARVKSGNAAPGQDVALRIGDWWHYWPSRAPQERVIFKNSPGAKYRLCWDTGCADLDFLLPRAASGEAVGIASCFAPK